MGTDPPDSSTFSDVIGPWADAGTERDRQADEREADADVREAVADEREVGADERERDLNAREGREDRRARLAGEEAPSALQRSQEASDRARALLAASEDRMARADANVARAVAHKAREDWATQQEIATSGRLLDSADMSRQANLDIYVQQLHARYLTAAARLADAHDMVARHHEHLAQDDASTAEVHRGRSRQERQAALHIRTAAHQATYPEDAAVSADLPPDVHHTP
ncbi:hypothetical protein [Streptomyces endophyticus]|uniref:Uncharacterized protein n=1 Tax=Streptomyces endophyticus TaxID=714166 RepID=A0ABU6F8G1_9ACTN|nr:hypothetical protein [Streptomyces endophyticus]MEB8340301.1 hypothetical protein [Streptomyces endophyticus]